MKYFPFPFLVKKPLLPEGSPLFFYFILILLNNRSFVHDTLYSGPYFYKIFLIIEKSNMYVFWQQQLFFPHKSSNLYFFDWYLAKCFNSGIVIFSIVKVTDFLTVYLLFFHFQCVSMYHSSSSKTSVSTTK